MKLQNFSHQTSEEGKDCMSIRDLFRNLKLNSFGYHLAEVSGG